MNKSIDFSQAGGLYVYQDTLDFMQQSYGQTSDVIAAAVGDKVVMSGCIDQGASVTAGWISYNGEILPFLGGLKAPAIIVEIISENEQFDDAQQRSVYTTKRLKFGNVIPLEGGFLYDELQPFAFKSASISTALNSIQTVLKSIVNFENAVILDGCTVSNVVGSNMQVSTGVVMFSGQIVLSVAYNGAFPAYLTPAGTWVTIQPGTGDYIKFDPYTSQRYKDVLRRFNYQTGDVLMSKVLSDRFDINTGIGKWEWLGFKLSEDLKGRVPVGFWFGVDGNPTVYDAAYRTINNFGGEKNHTLTKSELPNVTLGTNIYRNSQDYVDGGAAANNIGTNANPSNPAGAVTEIQTDALGDGIAFNIRQAYRVLALIERI